MDAANSALAILPYRPEPARFEEWDPDTPNAAAWLIDFLQEQIAGIQVEHFGSTAVEGCGGKGVIDVMVLYPPGSLEAVRGQLDQLGLQKQSGRDPFPEERPMRIGAFEWNGKRYRIHAHVLAENAEEAARLRAFRDSLRNDSELRDAYIAAKRSILGRGITDTIDYCNAKSEFIERSAK